jgi:hypothetical protein
MKIAMKLTLDGMIRALRMRAHELGEVDYDEAERRATRRNEKALTLLAQEARRYQLEAGDEFGR